ncbi:GroES-like protein, partial [Aureobasidium melanogenum]
MAEQYSKVYKGSPAGVIKETRHIIRPLAENEVLISISHSGVCGTDEHYKQQVMVLGHEGVGIVIEIGPGVKSIHQGDRVGWGCCHGIRGNCWECSTGQNLYCDARQLYGFDHYDQGSFASHAVWDETALFHIPESISSEHAAPLMCAGAAVYSALMRAACRPSQRIGVLGIGGLGHLAIQFAAKMGCEVVAFSSSAGKEAEALLYGAREFRSLLSGEPASSAQRVDCLLITAASQPDWNKVLPWIKRGGTISAMTVDFGELRLPYLDMVMNAIQFQGSLPAPCQMHREMLAFAALHKIQPSIELFRLDKKGIDTAMEKLRRGQIRYRAVLQG